MKVSIAMATTIACLLQTGCATSNDAAAYADTPRDEGVVLTGSRIPQRVAGSTGFTGSATVNAFSKEAHEDEMRRLQRPYIEQRGKGM